MNDDDFNLNQSIVFIVYLFHCDTIIIAGKLSTMLKYGSSKQVRFCKEFTTLRERPPEVLFMFYQQEHVGTFLELTRLNQMGIFPVRYL